MKPPPHGEHHNQLTITTMFTWIPLYEEIARKILEFENRQAELLAFLGKLRTDGLKVIQLNDLNDEGNVIPLGEIDPLTFFASFNRTKSVPGRQAILERIKTAWKLSAPVPEDFNGIPLANAQNSWAFAYAMEREANDVPVLWRVAREGVEKDWRTFDQNLFNEALGISQMGLARMSMSLFWMKPKAYLSLDKNTRAFFERKGIVCNSKTASGYSSWIEKVVAEAGDNFPQISRDAYRAFGAEDPEDPDTDEDNSLHLREAPEVNSSRRYWTLSAGEGGEMWSEFHNYGIAAIGWDELGDLARFRDKEEIRLKLKELWPSDSSRKNDAHTCWQFAHNIKVGDVIFAKQGLTKVLGYGVVESNYAFDEKRPNYRHVHRVKWHSKGEWKLPEDSKMALKTLTEVTRWPDFVKKIGAITGLEFGDESVIEQKPRVSSAIAYWWLNANPKIWDFRTAPIGSVQTYTSHNEAGNKRQKYKHFVAVKPGDLLFGYVTTPDKEIVALCEITKALHGPPGNEVIEFKKIEQFSEPVTWSELQAVPVLSECEPIESNQGSLFTLTAEEYEAIRALIDERNIPTQLDQPIPFTKADALAGLFMSSDELDTILARLKRKKALILQGPPGVGKTFIARRLAFALMGKRDTRRVAMVQFHPSYGYEDFVQGFRPTRTGLERRDGVFYQFARLAKNDPNRDWFFIIDEINRGNLAKIFGELLMLIEADKRGPDHAIPLTYSDGPEETFQLPQNLHLIGTMNTADRSLAMVDYALRRRFSFVTLNPALDSPAFAAWLKERNASDALVARIRAKIGNLNEVIENERDLGPGFRIGHSFFCPSHDHSPDEGWYREIIAGEIRPLLE